MSTVSASLAIFQPNATMTLASILRAEKLGVPSIWVPTAPGSFDGLTLLAAAAMQTKRVCLGTAVVPIYGHHPTALASDALVLGELAPGRFRLGIGSSHPFIVEGMYGIPFGRPLVYMREYMTVLRSLLWEGAVNFTGKYFNVHAQLPPGTVPPRPSIPVATLRPRKFRLAGEISDGALAAWCPIPYLLNVALPAMREGARKANRPTPPLYANVPIVFSTDRAIVHQVGRAALNMYCPVPAYVEMFAAAGFPLGADGKPTEALLDELFVYGDAATIEARLRKIHALGIDELMVTVHFVADPVAEETAAMRLTARLSRVG